MCLRRLRHSHAVTAILIHREGRFHPTSVGLCDAHKWTCTADLLKSIAAVRSSSVSKEWTTAWELHFPHEIHIPGKLSSRQTLMPPIRSSENSYIDDDFSQGQLQQLLVDHANFLDIADHSIYPEQTIYDTKEDPRKGSKGDQETTPWWSGTCWLRRSLDQLLYGWFRRKFRELIRC
ncbi:hypothetical protein pipiens_000786, partial [Culex pipiens pipiens]